MDESNSLNDPEIAEILIAAFLPDPSERWIALRQLLKSSQYAESVAPGAWGVTLYRNLFRLNVGRVEVLVVGEGGIRLNCVGQVGDAPFLGQRFSHPGYRSVPDPKCAFAGPIAEYARIEASLQQSHRRFVEVVGTRKDGTPVAGSGLRKSHSQGLMIYAQRFVASPEGGPAVEAYWMSDDEDLPDDPLVEGGRLALYVNAYERNSVARERCIEHYGAECAVCGFSAARTYGDAVRELIQVHHLRPLSEIGSEYVVDPVRDLRPVCPNCHAVIHAREPAFTIDEVKEMLSAAKRRLRHGRA